MQRLLLLFVSSWLWLHPLQAAPNAAADPSTDSSSVQETSPAPDPAQSEANPPAKTEPKASKPSRSRTTASAKAPDPEAVETAVDLAENHGEELQKLKKLLDSPAERASLKRQLDTLDKLKKIDERNRLKEAQQNAKLRETLLKSVTERVRLLGEDFSDLGALLHDSPELLGWIQQQWTDDESRSQWLDGILDLLLVIGLGYLSLLGASLAVNPLKRRLDAKHPSSYWHKALVHLSLPLLDLLPILIFAASSFVLLAVVEPNEISRAIALTWINSSIIARSLLIALHHLMRQEPVRWRLFTLGRAATLARRSLQLLVPLAVYGYFFLQLGLLLDMPVFLYKLLNFSLLLVLVLLLIKTIHRQRRQSGATQAQSSLSRWLGNNWHWLAQLYLLVLPLTWLFGNERGLEWLLTGTAWSLLVLFVYSMVRRAVHHLIERRILFDGQRFEQTPSLKARTQRHLRISEYGLNALMLLTVACALLQIWGFDLLAWLQTAQGKDSGRVVLVIIAIISLSFVSWVLLSNMIESFLVAKDPDSNKAVLTARYRTLLGVARNALFIAVLILATLMILSELGVNIAPLLAGAGVLGLAIGFGSQRLVQDMITGIFILLEDQVAVDDVIIAGGLTGRVEAISIRTLKLRDAEGRIHIIPFSAISTITNTTRDFSYFVFQIAVAYSEDPEQVGQVIRDVGKQLLSLPDIKTKILEPIEVFGVESFGESSLNIKGRIKTRAGEQATVARVFNLYLKRQFDLHEIQVPTPGSLRLVDAPQKLKSLSARDKSMPAKDSKTDLAVPLKTEAPAAEPTKTPDGSKA